MTYSAPPRANSSSTPPNGVLEVVGGGHEPAVDEPMAWPLRDLDAVELGVAHGVRDLGVAHVHDGVLHGARVADGVAGSGSKATMAARPLGMDVDGHDGDVQRRSCRPPARR